LRLFLSARPCTADGRFKYLADRLGVDDAHDDDRNDDDRNDDDRNDLNGNDHD
jgi:hypothetical protein